MSFFCKIKDLCTSAVLNNSSIEEATKCLLRVSLKLKQSTAQSHVSISTGSGPCNVLTPLVCVHWQSTPATHRLTESSDVVWDRCLRTRPVWNQTNRSWSCTLWSRSYRSGVVKYGFVTLIVIMILKDTANFQVLFIVSLFCAGNITTVINSGVHLLKS